MWTIRIILERAEQGHPGRYRPLLFVAWVTQTQPSPINIQIFHQSRVPDPSLQSEAAQFFSQGPAPQPFNLSGLSAALPLQQTPILGIQPSRQAPWNLQAQTVQQHDATMQGWATDFLAEEQRARSPTGVQLVQGPIVNANAPQLCVFFSLLVFRPPKQ
jgi:hypothetical protein